jgi:hypothetical protein
MHEIEGPGLQDTQEQSEDSGTSRNVNADSEVMAHIVSATSLPLHYIHSRSKASGKVIPLSARVHCPRGGERGIEDVKSFASRDNLTLALPRCILMACCWLRVPK